MVQENNLYGYVGTEMPDGQLRLEGPLPGQQIIARCNEIAGRKGKAPIVVNNHNVGTAILDAIRISLNRDRFAANKEQSSSIK